jgi:small subunit ribosomal protein S11
MAKPKQGGRPKAKRNVDAEGIAFVQATFNNTIVTITDMAGNAVVWGSAGKAGFKGSQEEHALRRDPRRRAGREGGDADGDARVHVRVAGPGSGRESAIQALAAAGLGIRSIRDVTPIPHNGCRPPKKRRV